MKQKTFKLLKTIALLAGCILLIELINKLGWKNIAKNIIEIGWYFFGAVAISHFAIFLHAVGWHQTLSQAKRRPTLWKVWLGKIAGEAVNNITPANFLGGDPFRIYFLRHNVTLTEGTASIVIDRTLYAFSTIAIITIGIVISFIYIPDIPVQIKILLPAIITTSITAVIFLCIHQHKGLFGLITNVLKKLRIKKNFSEKTLERLARLDNKIIIFYTKNRRGFILALLSHILGRFLAIVEIYYIGKLISPAFSFVAAIFLGVLSTIINFLFTFIPGSIGVLESAYGGASYFLSIEPNIGVSIQLLRRIRSLITTLVGFAIITLFENKCWQLQQKIIKEETVYAAQNR